MTEPATDALAPLTLDLLAWIAENPRPWPEVMERWRTSCPQLTVWEDALAAGLVARRTSRDADGRIVVTIATTEAGAAVLRNAGR